MNESQVPIITEKDGVVLRRAQDGDLPTLDEIVVICYTPIHDSYVQVVGEECAREPSGVVSSFLAFFSSAVSPIVA